MDDQVTEEQLILEQLCEDIVFVNEPVIIDITAK